MSTSSDHAEGRSAHLAYTFTADRYAQATSLYVRCRVKPGLRWAIHILALALTVLVVTGCVLVPHDPLPWVLLPVGPILLFRQPLNRWFWTRQFRRNKLCGQLVEVTVSEAGIQTAIPGKSEGHLDWSLVDGLAVRGREILVLQSNRRIFHYFPGDAYTMGSEQDVLQLGEGKVPIWRIS